jgi:hypothetical protein
MDLKTYKALGADLDQKEDELTFWIFLEFFQKLLLRINFPCHERIQKEIYPFLKPANKGQPGVRNNEVN